MVKKIGKLKDVDDLTKIKLEEGESVIVDGIENIRIIIERKKEIVPNSSYQAANCKF